MAGVGLSGAAAAAVRRDRTGYSGTNSDSADITVYEPVPGGQMPKGSLAAHAGD